MNTRKKYLAFAFLSIILILILIISISIIYVKNINIHTHWLIIELSVVIWLILTSYTINQTILYFAQSREIIKKSFNGFVEDIMDSNSIGLIIYDVEKKILYTTKYIRTKFKKDFIGKNIFDFFKEINPKYKDLNFEANNFNISNDNNDYEVQFWPLNNVVVIRDITTESIYKNEIWEQKPVIAELEIDNYSLYQSILSEEQLFKINSIVINIINECVKKYNIIYRQYTNGKFLIFTNELTLKELIENNFDPFMNIQEDISREEININKLSLSIGVAHGWNSLNEKLEQAKKALVQAQSRGGDQVAIFSNFMPHKYYGSNNEILPDNNRTKIREVSSYFSKKLEDTKIKNVIIYGHRLADLDALGSAYAIHLIAKKFGKKSYICSETYDSTVENWLESNPWFNKSQILINRKQSLEYSSVDTLIVLVDNSDPLRTDNPNLLVNTKRENIFIFDHHRVAKQVDYALKTNVFIDTSSSSASEIVTEILMFLSYKNILDTNGAQMLLNGIYLDTNNFSKSATPRAFEAAAWLGLKGANPVISRDLLKIDEKTEKLIESMLSNITEIKEGFYLAYSDIEVTNDVISIAANEVLKIKGRVASFVVARLKGTKKYKLSARGINANVQIICEAVGGGGHFSVAAAESDEQLEVFIDNIKHAISQNGNKEG
ncbi:DHH family phosphoesterase [Mycoplasma sp. CSL7503-lung]|uniref:DHH family phosphoesterase n=1 Tax=Mycoplasma sp. CSL7503-lung TaxID=536372 RepID=UPI0021D07B7A|nr:DHH family phosphoesterase [Mycoplasma sp. CSL7503-lung]MCU4706826.1 DHH family phosphoesterase [Mycoplasma sp. CSL7503-lung]